MSVAQIGSGPGSGTASTLASPTDTRQKDYEHLKARVHQDLLNRLNLERLTRVKREEAEPEIRRVIAVIIEGLKETTPMSLLERETLVTDVLNELFGLGPLAAPLRDPSVSDILVNRANQIYVEREGKLEETDVIFKDDRHLMQIIERIVSSVGRRIDESSPMVDARLQDGSRVNAIIPPLALDGPVLSIRRFRTDRLGAQDLVTRDSMTQHMLDFLKAAVGCRLNVIVSGGTGAGKTTLLNILSSFIGNTERIVTIEDAAELLLRQSHVVRLETRPQNIEGKGGVRQRDLVVNALRMRPDRIIMGEVRGDEALDMLQAMNTGHDGSMSTIHANSPRDALARVEQMVGMAGFEMSPRSVRAQIASAIHVVIQLARGSDGKRRMVSLQEVTGLDGDLITTNEIFHFRRISTDESGVIHGQYETTGIRPKFADELGTQGFHFDEDFFAPNRKLQ